VFRADKLCATLRTISRFLTRTEFSRKVAESLWYIFRGKGELKSVDGLERWTALKKELG
jgi:hypothetical protein